MQSAQISSSGSAHSVGRVRQLLARWSDISMQGSVDVMCPMQATWLHASHEQRPDALSRIELGESWAADADREAAHEVGAASMWLGMSI